MKDVECPYCGKEQEIDHDDGYGYDEDKLCSQECSECEQYFVYTTAITFSHTAYKADCLNGSEHNYQPTITFPKTSTRMECVDCGEMRSPTTVEWKKILYPNKK